MDPGCGDESTRGFRGEEEEEGKGWNGGADDGLGLLVVARICREGGRVWVFVFGFWKYCPLSLGFPVALPLLSLSRSHALTLSLPLTQKTDT